VVKLVTIDVLTIDVGRQYKFKHALGQNSRQIPRVLWCLWSV